MFTAFTPINQPIIWPANAVSTQSTSISAKNSFTAKDLGLNEGIHESPIDPEMPTKEEEAEFYKKAYSSAD